MKRFSFLFLVIVLVLSFSFDVCSEEVYSIGIPIVVDIKLCITYYGGPLDPDGNGTTYIAGTEPDYIVHDDGTWEIIPSQ